MLKKMFEEAFHCCQDAELIRLIWSPEKSFQIIHLFVQCDLFEMVELDPVS
jgi:hypothetical protein